MGRKTLEVVGLDKLLERIDKLGGQSRKICEQALIETHRIVTQKAEEGMSPSNLPANGKYSNESNEKTLRSLQYNADVEWSGDVASIQVGFDIEHGGLASIFLMYGTPRMKKDKALYNAFYGAETKKQIIEAQENVFYGEIRRLTG